MAESDHAALVKLLKSKDLKGCPACGNANWVIINEPFFVSFANPDPDVSGFRAIGVFCSNCGLMHLHNYAALKADAKVLERAAQENKKANESD
jgi:hypothetical protein